MSTRKGTPRPSRPKQPRVLIGDDDEGIRLLAHETLVRSGFEAHDVVDGTAVLEAFPKLLPDLVVLDVQMPGLDGFEVCARIRGSREGRLTPVLIITGLDDMASIERAYEVGATDFITKPINWPLFRHRARYLLRASRAMAALDESRVALAEAQRLARMGHWEYAVPNRLLKASEELRRLLDLAPDREVTPRQLVECVDERDRASLEDALRRSVESTEPVEVHLRSRSRPEGSRIFQVRLEAAFSELGEPLRLKGIVQDVTEKQRAQEKIQQLAHYDTLTRLPNRLLFRDRLERSLARARRKRESVCILFADLDDFKRINDTLGHTAGDELLCQVAARLVACVRSSDHVGRMDAEADGGRVSRLGGDEFTIVLDPVKKPDDGTRAAERVLECLSAPFVVQGRECVVSASIGIAVFPGDGADAETLLQNADVAMYDAKARGGNLYRCHSNSMHEASVRRVEIEADLRKAIERDEFLVYFQPRLELASARITGAEALVRWQHPHKGLVPPGEFIAIAEGNGLIGAIGEHVLRRACRWARTWLDAGIPAPKVGVNISSRQLREEGLAANVEKILAEVGLPSSHLELELTESSILEDEEAALRTLTSFKEAGMSLALDDFGTGYSSLSYLRRYPFDVLKIDRSFVRDLGADPDGAAIVSTIIAMAKRLGLTTVAEGVEEEEQRHFLAVEGCDAIQGFLIARPMPPEDYARFLREWSRGHRD